MKKFLFILLTGLLVGCSTNTESNIEVIEPTSLVLETGKENEVIRFETEFGDYESYSGDILVNTSDTLGFICENRYSTLDCGGSYTDKFSVVISNNVITIYNTSYNTTADNGYTSRYEISTDSSFLSILNNTLSEYDWVSTYTEIRKFISGHSAVTMSKGMSDTSSKDEDGNYFWEIEFNKLLGN